MKRELERGGSLRRAQKRGNAPLPQLPPRRQIRQASINEAGIAAYILNAAVRWTSALGHPLWQMERFDAESLRDRAVRGELFLCFEKGHPAATFQLMTQDLLHWPASTEPSLFLHKVAVDDHARGQGWLRDIVDWALQRAEHSDARFLRLDTVAGGRLEQLYQDLGFALCGFSPAPVTPPLVLLQREV